MNQQDKDALAERENQNMDMFVNNIDILASMHSVYGKIKPQDILTGDQRMLKLFDGENANEGARDYMNRILKERVLFTRKQMENLVMGNSFKDGEAVNNALKHLSSLDNVNIPLADNIQRQLEINKRIINEGPSFNLQMAQTNMQNDATYKQIIDKMELDKDIVVNLNETRADTVNNLERQFAIEYLTKNAHDNTQDSVAQVINDMKFGTQNNELGQDMKINEKDLAVQFVGGRASREDINRVVNMLQTFVGTNDIDKRRAAVKELSVHWDTLNAVTLFNGIDALGNEFDPVQIKLSAETNSGVDTLTDHQVNGVYLHIKPQFEILLRNQVNAINKNNMAEIRKNINSLPANRDESEFVDGVIKSTANYDLKFGGDLELQEEDQAEINNEYVHDSVVELVSTMNYKGLQDVKDVEDSLKMAFTTIHDVAEDDKNELKRFFQSLIHDEEIQVIEDISRKQLSVIREEHDELMSNMKEYFTSVNQGSQVIPELLTGLDVPEMVEKLDEAIGIQSKFEEMERTLVNEFDFESQLSKLSDNFSGKAFRGEVRMALSSEEVINFDVYGLKGNIKTMTNENLNVLVDTLRNDGEKGLAAQLREFVKNVMYINKGGFKRDLILDYDEDDFIKAFTPAEPAERGLLDPFDVTELDFEQLLSTESLLEFNSIELSGRNKLVNHMALLNNAARDGFENSNIDTNVNNLKNILGEEFKEEMVEMLKGGNVDQKLKFRMMQLMLDEGEDGMGGGLALRSLDISRDAFKMKQSIERASNGEMEISEGKPIAKATDIATHLISIANIHDPENEFKEKFVGVLSGQNNTFELQQEMLEHPEHSKFLVRCAQARTFTQFAEEQGLGGFRLKSLLTTQQRNLQETFDNKTKLDRTLRGMGMTGTITPYLKGAGYVMGIGATSLMLVNGMYPTDPQISKIRRMIDASERVLPEFITSGLNMSIAAQNAIQDISSFKSTFADAYDVRGVMGVSSFSSEGPFELLENLDSLEFIMKEYIGSEHSSDHWTMNALNPYAPDPLIEMLNAEQILFNGFKFNGIEQSIVDNGTNDFHVNAVLNGHHRSITSDKEEINFIERNLDSENVPLGTEALVKGSYMSDPRTMITTAKLYSGVDETERDQAMFLYDQMNQQLIKENENSERVGETESMAPQMAGLHASRTAEGQDKHERELNETLTDTVNSVIGVTQRELVAKSKIPTDEDLTEEELREKYARNPRGYKERISKENNTQIQSEELQNEFNHLVDQIFNQRSDIEMFPRYSEQQQQAVYQVTYDQIDNILTRLVVESNNTVSMQRDISRISKLELFGDTPGSNTVQSGIDLEDIMIPQINEDVLTLKSKLRVIQQQDYSTEDKYTNTLDLLHSGNMLRLAQRFDIIGGIENDQAAIKINAMIPNLDVNELMVYASDDNSDVKVGGYFDTYKWIEKQNPSMEYVEILKGCLEQTQGMIDKEMEKGTTHALENGQLIEQLVSEKHLYRQMTDNAVQLETGNQTYLEVGKGKYLTNMFDYYTKYGDQVFLFSENDSPADHVRKKSQQNNFNELMRSQKFLASGGQTSYIDRLVKSDPQSLFTWFKNDPDFKLNEQIFDGMVRQFGLDPEDFDNHELILEAKKMSIRIDQHISEEFRLESLMEISKQRAAMIMKQQKNAPEILKAGFAEGETIQRTLGGGLTLAMLATAATMAYLVKQMANVARRQANSNRSIRGFLQMNLPKVLGKLSKAPARLDQLLKESEDLDTLKRREENAQYIVSMLLNYTKIAVGSIETVQFKQRFNEFDTSAERASELGTTALAKTLRSFDHTVGSQREQELVEQENFAKHQMMEGKISTAKRLITNASSEATDAFRSVVGMQTIASKLEAQRLEEGRANPNAVKADEIMRQAMEQRDGDIQNVSQAVLNTAVVGLKLVGAHLPFNYVSSKNLISMLETPLKFASERLSVTDHEQAFEQGINYASNFAQMKMLKAAAMKNIDNNKKLLKQTKLNIKKKLEQAEIDENIDKYNELKSQLVKEYGWTAPDVKTYFEDALNTHGMSQKQAMKAANKFIAKHKKVREKAKAEGEGLGPPKTDNEDKVQFSEEQGDGAGGLSARDKPEMQEYRLDPDDPFNTTPVIVLKDRAANEDQIMEAEEETIEPTGIIPEPSKKIPLSLSEKQVQAEREKSLSDPLKIARVPAVKSTAKQLKPRAQVNSVVDKAVNLIREHARKNDPAFKRASKNRLEMSRGRKQVDLELKQAAATERRNVAFKKRQAKEQDKKDRKEIREQDRLSKMTPAQKQLKEFDATLTEDYKKHLRKIVREEKSDLKYFKDHGVKRTIFDSIKANSGINAITMQNQANFGENYSLEDKQECLIDFGRHIGKQLKKHRNDIQDKRLPVELRAGSELESSIHEELEEQEEIHRPNERENRLDELFRMEARKRNIDDTVTESD